MILDALRIIENPDFDARFALPSEFFEELEKLSEDYKLPIWNDKLYLQYHRGTYTTQARFKKLHKEAELKLIEAEKISSTASLYGFEYPKNLLDKLWEKLLFNQFHDILAGSSIKDVYDDAIKEVSYVLEKSKEIIRDSTKWLSSKICLVNDGLVVFNTLPWKRNDIIELPIKDFRIVDASGNPCLIQREENSKTLILVEDLSPLGFKVFYKSNIARIDKQVSIIENSEEIIISNGLIKVVVNKSTGNIVGLYKGSEGNFIDRSRGGVHLQVFKDVPVEGRMTLESRWDAESFDAWEVYIFQQPEGVSLEKLLKPLKVYVKDKGPVKASVIVEYVYEQENRPPYKVNVEYIVYSKIDYVVIKIDVD